MTLLDIPSPSSSLTIEEFLPTSSTPFYGKDIKDLFYGDIPKVTPRPRDPRELQNTSDSPQIFKSNLLSVPPLNQGKLALMKFCQLFIQKS